MNLLTLLQQTPTLDIPWWVQVILLPGAGWLAAQVFPILRDRAQQTIQDEQEERKHRLALDERGVKAQENMAAAVDQIGRTLAVMQFQISTIERHLGMSPDDKVVPRQRDRDDRKAP